MSKKNADSAEPDAVVYLTPLWTVRYQKQHGTANFILAKEFRVVVKGVLITVPAGFATDFSSVPRPFRWLVSVVDGIEGSVIHDFLYRYPGEHTHPWSDEVLGVMDKDQVPWFIRTSKMIGVKLGGWYTWNQARKKDDTDEATGRT